MVQMISPETVKSWLSDGQEIALVDVRENGQFGDGHPFFAVSAPYGVFEERLIQLVPNPSVRLVLYDHGDGLAERTAALATDLNYTNIFIMQGGAPAWAAAGYTLFQGVNVPSKTFGELLELEHHTPNLTAEQLANLSEDTPNHIIVDSRPYNEYHKFNIPGGICCHNGEVALRIGELVPDPTTTIVVNCAGRTRSILGAETLRAFGVPNPVYALENGTQGWLLAGLQREEGATRSFNDAPVSEQSLAAAKAKANACAAKSGLSYIDAAWASDWLWDTNRTTYLFDVRTAEEFADDGIPGSRHVLGGQLVQATEDRIGVKGSRVILMDDEMVRAPMMANWLHQIGYEVAILQGGVSALRGTELPEIPEYHPASILLVTPEEAKTKLDTGKATILDLRSVRAYRTSHIDIAKWTIRLLLEALELTAMSEVILIAGSDTKADLVSQRLAELGVRTVYRLTGDEAAWHKAGFEMIATPNEPADADVEELLFYVHQRNVPNNSEASAKAYIAWEIGLVDQLDAQERASFRLNGGPA